MHFGVFLLECISYDSFQVSTIELLEIGVLLREARRRYQRTQGALARALGMSRTTISAFEGGRCEEIGIRKLTALLGVVGLDLSVGPRKKRPTLDDLRAERRSGRRRA